MTGGFVYRGSLYSSLWGRYFFADYIDGKIWSMYKSGAGPEAWSTPELELRTGLNISAFGEDEDGELYVVSYADGTIRHLVDANGPGPDLGSSEKSASSSSADPGEVLTYTISLRNSGAPFTDMIFFTDTVPAGLDYIPGSMEATQGSVNDTQSPVLQWQGPLSPPKK